LGQIEDDSVVSLSKNLHLWTLSAEQGSCESAEHFGRHVLSQPHNVRTLDISAHNSLMLTTCLWLLYRNTGNVEQARTLRSELEFFDAKVLQQETFRHAAIMATPMLVENGVWSLDLAHRVLNYSLGFPGDISLVEKTALEMSETYPLDGQMYLLAAISETARGDHAKATMAFQDARKHMDQDLLECTLLLNERPFLPSSEDTKLLWFADFDHNLTWWNMLTGWIGGEYFWPAQFLWQHDQVTYVEGSASLRLSGIWMAREPNKESPRFAIILRLPDLPAGKLRVRFFYRTYGVPDSQAQVWFVVSDNDIRERWLLPATGGCWQSFDISFDWEQVPQTDLVVWFGALGDFWIDGLAISKEY
jgi:hypothetical protein